MLSAGDRLGPYEILSSIGAGGMGEVYRARDPRVGRDVAIKVSKEQFSDRFEREARAVAALNHPNVCHLYDVGPDYLVMEYVEGESPKGPMPLDEALQIARQITDALEAAHERGIVHRDLKPANIRIKPDGTVKVLDFGLAKTVPPASAPAADSPTFTMSATVAGVILGTAAYMAPEQARGKPVDKRADIWAFGALLYEMLTGRPLFRGEDVSEVLAAVIRETPSLEGAPVSVHTLLRRCLEKDPKQRLRDIGDVWALLQTEPIRQAQAKSRTGWLGWALAAMMAVAAGAALWAPWRTPAPLPEVFAYRLPMPPQTSYVHSGGFKISPDGRILAFTASGADGVARIWVQPLDSLAEAHPLTGTEGTAFPVFWSFDSRWVMLSLNGKLMKVAIGGGAPVILCDLNGLIAVGGSENAAGRILLGAGSDSIWQVPSSGGPPVRVTRLDPSRGENAHNNPRFLPDGRHFLYLRRCVSPEKTGAYIGDLESPPDRQSMQPLLVNRTAAWYARSRGSHPGFVLFLRDTNLFAQPFEEKTLRLTGDPVRVADQVGSFLDGGSFSVADNGVLIYRPATNSVSQVTWVDRQGKRLSTVGRATTLAGSPTLSPNGTQVLVSRLSSQNMFQLWRIDLEKNQETQLTALASNQSSPVWSPDGSEVVFSSDVGGRESLLRKAVNGATEEVTMLESNKGVFANSWSRDGRFLLYTAMDPKTGPDIWLLRLDGTRRKVRLMSTPAAEQFGSFSPNMRWMAYSSAEPGSTAQILVRELIPEQGENPFRLGPAQIISRNGGDMPVWRGDGKELFYQTSDSSMMAVVMGGGDRASGPLDPGEPVRLFQEAAILPFLRNWSISRNGERFLFASPAAEAEQVPFKVVLNWQERLGK
jgi:eukaryotic-like serine/threonine-protein kinase